MPALVVTLATSVGAFGAVGDAVSQPGPLVPLIALGLIARRRAASRRTAPPAWLIAASLALAAGLIAWLLQPLFPRWPAPSGAAPAVRIVEFNSWIDNRTPVLAARWILAERPDVVVLLEGARAPLIHVLMQELPFRTSCNRDGPCTTMILSRARPAERRGLAHGDADNHKALSAAYVRFGAPGRGFAVLAVHLSHSWPWGRQRAETRALVAAMAGTSNDRLIVTGDFNASPWSNSMRRIEAGLVVSPIGGEAASWPARRSRLPLPPLLWIDHTLLGPGWRGARSVRGPALGSDHFPFLVTLTPDNR